MPIINFLHKTAFSEWWFCHFLPVYNVFVLSCCVCLPHRPFMLSPLPANPEVVPLEFSKANPAALLT